MNTTPTQNPVPVSKPVEMPKAKKVLVTDEDDNGKFEIAIRILSNEVFALAISANPFNKRWIVYSLITMGFLLFAVSAFGDSIVSFSTGMYSAVNAE